MPATSVDYCWTETGVAAVAEHASMFNNPTAGSKLTSEQSSILAMQTPVEQAVAAGLLAECGHCWTEAGVAALGANAEMFGNPAVGALLTPEQEPMLATWVPTDEAVAAGLLAYC